ncbi:hypothetical protein PRZ48_000616 [Zasmidium cellare]|uniref:Zn(2)-C6 fungal-type domain-containing protein n=1 Tax=Zasmidium cellare TaxID=395010 RepID=A0ABR0F085_ZASCE|nr:hypothetical protein PRZ48_000616 [Zasmidium cellare]
MSPGKSSGSETLQAQRTKTGCQNCRQRHLKCDERRPACARCEKSGIECVRGYNIRFRHGANPSVANLKDSGLAKTEYDFSKKQTWMRTAKNLTFLDETPELINIYDHNADEDNPYPTTFRWPDNTPTIQERPKQSRPRESIPQVTQEESSITSDSPATLSQQFPVLERPEAPQYQWPETDVTSQPQSSSEKHSYPSQSPADSHPYSDQVPSATSPAGQSFPKRRRLTFESTYQSSVTSSSPGNQLVRSPADSWHTGWTPSATIDNITSNSEIHLSSFPGLETTVSQSLSRIYLETPIWPLKDKEEANLLRYFVETLSRNFDLTDPLQHFRSVVPQRAAICPTLMNAIFALSARHLSRIGQYDPLISNKYHQECLKHLIPMLDDTAAILDENLLASTIILRHLEEFEVPISGQQPADQHSHLLGAQAFIAAQERAAVSGGLRQAAFWVGLRQEVYVAFVNQRPVLPALEHCNVDRSFEAAEDHIWACRMVVLCADVLRYCFSESQESQAQSLATCRYLVEQVQQWYDSKPASFTPVFHREPTESEVFPEIWYVSDSHATGIQHYHLSLILLTSHNPSIPRLGPGRTAALKTMDAEIRHHVRVLCGMSLSNPSNAPAFTYASMAASMAGERFTERREQEALLYVLDQCDKMHAWPTGVAIRNLKGAWGWEETENFVVD